MKKRKMLNSDDLGLEVLKKWTKFIERTEVINLYNFYILTGSYIGNV